MTGEVSYRQTRPTAPAPNEAAKLEPTVPVTTVVPTPRIQDGETPKGFLARLEGLWCDGVTADTNPLATDRPFPWKIAVARPTAQTIKTNMSAVIAWARSWLGNDLKNPQSFAGGAGLVYSTFGNKPNTFEAPEYVVMHSLDDLVQWLPASFGEQAQAARVFFQNAEDVHPKLRALAPMWRIVCALPVAERNAFLELLRFLRDHPALHTLDIRECVVPGLDTKWAERHAALVKAAKAIMDEAKTRPTGSLRSVLGLKEHNRQTLWLRFHPDDHTGPFGAPMFAIRPTDLTQLPKGVTQAVVVENLAPFENLSLHPGQVAVFGNGKAIVSMLARAPALQDPSLDLVYWGDMDSQGYLILDRARRVAPHLRSWRMDLSDVQSNTHLGVEEPRNAIFDGETHHLTQTEQDALAWIRQKRLRIEQEKLPAISAHAHPRPEHN